MRSGFHAADHLLSSTDDINGKPKREIASRFFEIVSYQNNFSTLISEALSTVALTFFGVALLSFYNSFLLAFSILIVGGCIFFIQPLARRGIEMGTKKSTDKYRFAHWLSEVAEHRTLLRQGSTDHILWKLTDNLIER